MAKYDWDIERHLNDRRETAKMNRAASVYDELDKKRAEWNRARTAKEIARLMRIDAQKAAPYLDPAKALRYKGQYRGPAFHREAVDPRRIFGLFSFGQRALRHVLEMTDSFWLIRSYVTDEKRGPGYHSSKYQGDAGYSPGAIVSRTQSGQIILPDGSLHHFNVTFEPNDASFKKPDQYWNALVQPFGLATDRDLTEGRDIPDSMPDNPPFALLDFRNRLKELMLVPTT